MAVGRYDTPARSEFMNTYVPIPFEQMVGAGQVQQQRYDQAAASLDQKLSDAANLKAIPDSVDEDYVFGIRRGLSEVAEEFSQKDLANPVVRRQLNARVRGMVDSDRINKIQDSYTNYQASRKAEAQLRSRGEYNELLEMAQDPALTGKYDSSDDTYQYLPSAYEDPTQAMRTYFTDIKSRILGDAELSSESKSYKAQGYGIRGVTEADIDRVTEESWRDFSDTVVGQREWKLFQLRNPDWREEGITQEDVMKGMLADIGDRFTRQEAFGSRYPQTRESDADTSDGPSRIYDSPFVSKAGHGKRSHRNVPSVEEITGTRATGKGFTPFKWLFKDTGFESLTEDSGKEPTIKGSSEEVAAYEDLKKRAQFYFGENSFEGLDVKEQYNKIQDYIDDFYNKGTSIIVEPEISEESQEETRNLMFNLNQKGNVEATNLAVHDPDDPITGEYVSFDEYVKEYPLNEYRYIPVGKISSDNPFVGDRFASGYQVEIYNTDEDGNTTTPEKMIYVGGDKRNNLYNSFAHSVHGAAHNLEPVTAVRGSLPLPDGPSGEKSSTRIDGQIGRRDYRGPDGKMYHEFIGEFSFIGTNGKSQTITIGTGDAPPNSTDELLRELRDRILSVKDKKSIQ